jgi:hypothetical protein
LLQDFNDFQKFALDHQDDDGFNNKKDLMDQATMNDMFYPSAKPSDITGQTLAVTMEADKNKVLNSMALPPTTSQLAEDHANNSKVQQLPSTWMEATTVDLAAQPKEVQASNSNGIQETQEVIEEIQEFLDQFADEGMDQNDEVRNLADELLSEGQKATLESMDVTDCPLANSTLNDEESAAAEDLLDQLIHGNFTSDEIKELEQSFATSNDTGYSSATQSFDVSNVSQFITVNGQNIIIVVAPDEVQQPMTMTTASTIDNTVLSSILPSTSESTNKKGEFDNERFVEIVDEDSNSSSGDEWLPEEDVTEDRRVQFKKPSTPPKNKPGRKKSNASTRSNGNISKLKVTTDRKERKKLQNVEAARRYRDKKKAQEQKQGTEEQELQNKNEQLKGELSGIEAELTTIKKLMTELGLIKLVTPMSLKTN